MNKVCSCFATAPVTGLGPILQNKMCGIKQLFYFFYVFCVISIFSSLLPCAIFRVRMYNKLYIVHPYPEPVQQQQHLKRKKSRKSFLHIFFSFAVRGGQVWLSHALPGRWAWCICWTPLWTLRAWAPPSLCRRSPWVSLSWKRSKAWKAGSRSHFRATRGKKAIWLTATSVVQKKAFHWTYHDPLVPLLVRWFQHRVVLLRALCPNVLGAEPALALAGATNFPIV